MLPAMKVNEKLLNNYITATERYSRPPARYTEASVRRTRYWSPFYPTISTIINRNLLRKEILMVKRKNTTTYVTSKQSWREVVKGSDKGN
jgi:DNA topoisomerase-1